MARPTRQSRRKAETRGRRAETLAALVLRLKGYQILASRVRTPVGEIDLIAKRGRVIAFVEVKQRKTVADALVAVPDRNWQRIAAAASNWMARQHGLQNNDWRYDIIALAPYKLPVHRRDYWRP